MGWLVRMLALLGLPSWILPLIIIGAVMASLGGAYFKGRWDAAATCREATLRAQIAILQRDIKVQREADAFEAEAMADLESLNNSQQMKIMEYEDANKIRPDHCPLSPADIDSLRKLGR